MKKVLLFTHGNDIDGMGSFILSNLVYKNVDVIYSSNVMELNKKIQDNYDKLYNYDLVYITDLSPNKELMNKIFSDTKLENKVFLFDHHETAFLDGLNKYKNTYIVIEDDNGKVCATQIFYNYLIDNDLIKDNSAIKLFVEMVRREDTWEWKKYNDQAAHDLSILFNILGKEKFNKIIINKLISNNMELSLEEKNMIADKKKLTLDIIMKYLSKMKRVVIDGYNVGICYIAYEYRNEVADYLKENDKELDVVAMIALDNYQISLRSIKDNDSARIIAEKYNGGGHDRAAMIPLTNELSDSIINTIFKLKQ